MADAAEILVLRESLLIALREGRQTAGLDGFRARHPRARVLLVAAGEMALEEFFASDPAELLRG